jgi:SRSO17 transposase
MTNDRTIEQAGFDTFCLVSVLHADMKRSEEIHGISDSQEALMAVCLLQIAPLRRCRVVALDTVDTSDVERPHFSHTSLSFSLNGLYNFSTNDNDSSMTWQTHSTWTARHHFQIDLYKREGLLHAKRPAFLISVSGGYYQDQILPRQRSLLSTSTTTSNRR